MSRHVVKMVLVIVVAGFIAWIASKTTFVETTVPMPPTGEAARNPFYPAQQLARQLGAEAEWERVFTLRRADSVIVLSAYNWSLSRARRERLQRWVEGGGRLVVDSSLIGDLESFGTWSGITRTPRIMEPDEERDENNHEELRELAGQFYPESCATLTGPSTEDGYSVCGIDHSHFLSSARKASWSLSDQSGVHVLRTAVGRGSVTVINARPFPRRELFLGDHARLFVHATQLHRGDAVLFLTEENRASLLTLAWRFGAPVIVIGLVMIALALWRASARFGPLLAPMENARRSLAEQIRGTGQFALRFGGGRSLHAAAVRALRDAAARRISGYDNLQGIERVAALARATGVRADELSPALDYSPHSHSLRNAIAVLETARRRLLMNKGSKHGNRIRHDHQGG